MYIRTYSKILPKDKYSHEIWCELNVATYMHSQLTTVPLKDNVALARSLSIATRTLDTRCSTGNLSHSCVFRSQKHSIEKCSRITSEILWF